jgi:hypothetical protein
MSRAVSEDPDVAASLRMTTAERAFTGSRTRRARRIELGVWSVVASGGSVRLRLHVHAPGH